MAPAMSASDEAQGQQSLESPLPNEGNERHHSTLQEESFCGDNGKHDGAHDGEHTDTLHTQDSDSDRWREDEHPPLHLCYDALEHIAECFVPGGHGKCIDILERGRGAFHEIRVLRFEDGFECIGRFTRDRQEASSVMNSEVATVSYVREHTSIPVPEIYFVNTDPHHVVGAPFVLMEKLHGQHLYCIWEKLGLNQKLEVIEQVADVLHELMELKFEEIGSLRAGGDVGPLQNLAYSYAEAGRGPFQSMSEWASSFLHPREKRTDAVMDEYPHVEILLHDFLRQQSENNILREPFRLIHGDFDAQNMLFTWEDEDDTPQLSGLIDWDNSWTGPLYYLCEYPIFIRDLDMPGKRELYDENEILRKYFVYRLSRHYPADSQERQDVLECFRQKSYTLNAFKRIFTGSLWADPDMELRVVTGYLKAHVPGSAEQESAYPYGGKLTWEPDSEYEGDSAEEDEDVSENEESEGEEEIVATEV